MVLKLHDDGFYIRLLVDGEPKFVAIGGKHAERVHCALDLVKACGPCLECARFSQAHARTRGRARTHERSPEEFTTGSYMTSCEHKWLFDD